MLVIANYLWVYKKSVPSAYLSFPPPTLSNLPEIHSVLKMHLSHYYRKLQRVLVTIVRYPLISSHLLINY